MSWFYLALVGPLLWSMVNHADKYLLSRYFRSGGVGGLLIFSSIFGICLLPIAYLAHPAAIDVPLADAVRLLALGCVIGLQLLLYLYALDREEASVVMPFYQLTPVFGVVLGSIFLHEVITGPQLLACLVIMLGGFILSLDLTGIGRIRVKGSLVLLMLGATLLLASSEVAFKFIALENSFWTATFWQYAGLATFGVFLFLVPSYRGQFFSVLRDNRRSIFALNAASEIVTLCGNLAFSFATLLAPIALVLTVESYQPLFVLALGIVLTVFAPAIAEEDISRTSLVQKGVATAILIFGTYLLQRVL